MASCFCTEKGVNTVLTTIKKANQMISLDSLNLAAAKIRPRDSRRRVLSGRGSSVLNDDLLVVRSKYMTRAF
jgi:hypothetical protein